MIKGYPSGSMAFNSRILGIDPGSRITGYGVIEKESGGRLKFVACGVVKSTPSLSFPKRLMEIYDGICEVIVKHGPDEAAIEDVFMSKNAMSALKLGHARGVLILAAIKHHLTVHEYTPLTVKQSVVGHGGADKRQVQHMIKSLLSLSGLPGQDASDALAVAVCHANMMRFEK